MPRELVGRMLGRYRIVERIGAGGMGVVFRAVDDALARTVALKVLGDDVAHDAERRARFMREARIAASIAHPNIATVYDVGETDDGCIYIAMELVAGTTLRARMNEGPMTLESVLRIAADLTRALIKAHERGVVHRDLKPDNVMVSGDDVKVLDFGLARAMDDPDSGATIASGVGRIMGTPGYMSPEQASGRVADERADIFSLGVVLYEMTTGARPFRGASAVDVLVATSRDEPAAPSSFREEISPALNRLILRCLEKNPDARFATAREAMDALEDAARTAAGAPSTPEKRGALPTEPSLAIRAWGTEAPRALLQRRRWQVGAMLAALLGVVTIGGHFAASRRAGSPPPPVPLAPPQPTAITDLPLPSSASPRAIAEYVAGVQALRDDDWGVAESHFLSVVELDPMMALGQLRLAMACEGTLDESIRREHFARAVTLRAQLGPRDQGMMDALEPVLQRLHEDRALASTRLVALAARYPADAEIFVWLGMMQQGTEAALTFTERASAIDPQDGQAWQSRGDALATLGRHDEARAAYEHCGAISAGSAECFLGLIWLDSTLGRCADAERDAHRAVDRDPGLTGNLACAMYGAGQPVAAVREVVDQGAAAAPTAPGRRLLDEARVAIVGGDFTTALALAEQYQALADGDARSPFRDHMLSTSVLIGIARETGAPEQAFAAAWRFVRRSDTWSKSSQSDSGLDSSMEIAREAMQKGGLSAAEFELRRAAWIAVEASSLAHRGLVWTYAYAATAETADEAAAALAVLPEYAPLSSFVYYAGIPDAEVGRVYLLAGDVDTALPCLQRAVASCAAFRHPFVHTRAMLDLGKALEARGRIDDACATYANVVARWGRAVPRSTSADLARERRKRLGCRI